jgi:hypothetical protein
LETEVRIRNRQSGVVISAELMLIALILVAGLVTAWIKLRDQSLAELSDSMAAIDAYLLGSASLVQTGGTRWIATSSTCTAAGLSSPCIVGPSATGVISETWGASNATYPTAVETSPGSDVYEKKGDVLTYGTPEAEAP